MGAKRAETVSLSHAQDVIANLEADLRWTMESVEILTRNGCHREALEIIEAQRYDLNEAMTALSWDAASSRRRRIGAGARSLIAAAAAAVIVLSVGVAVMRSSGVGVARPVAIAPTASQTSVHAASVSPRVASHVGTNASGSIATPVSPKRGTVHPQPPVVSNRVETAVRADGPDISGVQTTPTPVPTLPEFLHKIS